jgi:hypothetical protein
MAGSLDTAAAVVALEAIQATVVDAAVNLLINLDKDKNDRQQSEATKQLPIACNTNKEGARPGTFHLIFPCHCIDLIVHNAQ